MRVSKFVYSTLLLLAGVTQSQAGIIVDLSTPTYVGSTALLDINVNFESGSGEEIDYILLSIIGSDPDFSRFSFDESLGVLDAWDEIDDLGTLGYLLYFATVDPLLPGEHLLGTLAVDLSGLAAGTYTVTLNGGDPDFFTEFRGGLAFDPIAPLSFNQPDGVELTVETAAVPEPSSLVMLGMGIALLGGVHLKRRKHAVSNR